LDKIVLAVFETVQLRHFATEYDRLQQFFGLTTKYGQSRQNTTLYNSTSRSPR
jgi:hypothetical protein